MKIGPLSFSMRWWLYMWRTRERTGWCGIFRNLPHVIPGRWGFYFLGLEFGSRNPGDRFGAWLKRVGVWRW